MAKTTDKVLKYAGLAFVVYMVYNQVYNQVYNRIGFGMPGIALKGIRPNGLMVEIIVPLENRNPVGLPLDALKGQVMYGRDAVAELILNQPTIIEANSTTKLRFQTLLDFGRIGANVEQIVATGEWMKTLKFRGHAVSNGIVVPFENTFTIGFS